MGQALDRLKTALQAFTRYVPHDLVKSVLKTGKEVRLGGETAYVTVMFADVVGFSTSAEQLPPDEVVRILSVFLQEVDQVVRKHDGLVVQNVGDCVMAIWDAPIRTCGEPEKRACAAALDYVLQSSNPTSERPLEGRIGIHSGYAVVGNVGSDDVMSYTAIGDAVNVSSRIEGLTRIYGAKNLISEATAGAALDAFEMRRIDTVVLKGRTAALHIYEILARKGQLSPERAELRQRYESGLRLYQENDFAAAAEEFDHALQIDPLDRPSQVLLDRCLRYKIQPPANDWAGTFAVEYK
jgi:adenylate cyclase